MTFGGYVSSLTMPEIESLKESCHFTADEETIFDLLSDGRTIRNISYDIAMSERTISRKIRSIRAKINKIRSL